MVDTTFIRERMPVLDCRGEAIGTVEHLDAGRIRIARADAPDDPRRYLPLAIVSEVTEEAVRTQTDRREALALLQTAEAEAGHQEA